MRAPWKLTSQQESVWNHLYRKVMNITSLAKDTIRWNIITWYTNLLRCLKRWKFRMRKQQWTRNGRISKRFQPGNWTKLRAKRRLCWRHKETKWSQLWHIDGHLSSQECGVRSQISEVQGSSRAPRRQCKRRFGILCSIYWTRFISFANYCCKSNGCHCKITRLWRTRSRCDICLHSNKNGGRSKIAQNSEVRMFWYLDTSTTTQMAQIMGKHWRSSGSSWTKFVRTPTCGTFVGKTVRGSSAGTWMANSAELGMSICSLKRMIILIGIRGWHLNGRTEAEYGSHVGEIDQKCWSWRTNFISWSRIFGIHSTWMQTERSHWAIHRNVWITNFCCSNWKMTRVGKASRKIGLATWKDMLENALRDTASWQTKKWISCTKFQVPAWMITKSRRRSLNQWENYPMYAHKMVLKCLYLARMGRPDILWTVNKLARAVTKWTGACDKRLARLISYIHYTSDCRQYCHVGHTAQHCRLGLFQDPDFAGDLEDSKSTSIGMNVCLEVAHLFPLVGCESSKRQYPTFLQNPKSFRWMLDWERTGYLLFISGMWW